MLPNTGCVNPSTAEGIVLQTVADHSYYDSHLFAASPLCRITNLLFEIGQRLIMPG